MAATRTIEIPLSLTGAERVQQGLSQVVSAVESRMDAVGRAGERLANSVSSLSGAFGLLTGLLAVGALKESVHAFQEEQVAVSRVEVALRRLGPAAAEAHDRLVEQADALESLTGIANEQVLAAQAMLLTQGASVETTRNLIPLITDLAAAMGMDLIPATRLVGAALDGENIKLGRYNIEASDAEELTRKLSEAVGGQARALHEARGGWGALEVSWGNTQKAIGALLEKPVSGFLTGINSGVEKILGALQKWREGNDVTVGAATSGAETVGQKIGELAPIALVAAAGFKVLSLASGLLDGAFFVLSGQRLAGLLLAIQGLSKEAGLLASVFGTGASAANVLGVSLAALVVGLAGFSLGKAIAEVELFGDTINDRLVRGILTARQTWFMAVATIRDELGKDSTEARKEVRELQTAIDQTGAAWRRAQAEADEKRRAESDARREQLEAERASSNAGKPRQRDLDAARELAVMRGGINLAVDRMTLDRGQAALRADYDERRISLEEFEAYRREQINYARELELVEGMRKAQQEEDANKATVLREEAEAIASQQRITALEELERFTSNERKVADARAREEQIQAIDEETARKRTALAEDQGRVEGAFWLTTVEKREDLIRLDEEELRLLDEQIAALQERLRLETESAAQAQIRGQIRGAQSERSSVGRRRNTRQAEADPNSFRDQWDVTITAMQERMNTLAQGIAATFSATVQGAVDGIAGSIQGLIFATMSWGDALRNIGQSIVTALVGAISKMFAEWILKMTLIRGLESMFSVQRKTEVASEIPLNVANSAAASGGSFGTSAILGLIAFAALMAAALSFGGAFAKGGRPKRGAMNLVGEEGPELFIPDVSGTIIPADRTAAVLAGMGMPGGGGRQTSGAARSRPGAEASSIVLVDDRMEAERHLRTARGERRIQKLVRGEVVRMGVA